MEIGSTVGQYVPNLKGDGSEDRKPQETCGDDALGKGSGVSPRVVAGWLFGADAEGASGRKGEPLVQSRPEIGAAERQAIVAAGKLPVLKYPTTVDARGTEHSVRFRGSRVEKHQHSNGWVPIITPADQIGLAHASPSEYLRRLELQNELFGDDIRVIGLTRGNRFAITQPALKGGEPTEIEIRDMFEGAGWKRIPIALQDLPPDLMGFAWWHMEERVILLDARKPNLKKTDFGAVLPIDLILADLTPEMIHVLDLG